MALQNGIAEWHCIFVHQELWRWTTSNDP
jgi:hypothetical protein